MKKLSIKNIFFCFGFISMLIFSAVSAFAGDIHKTQQGGVNDFAGIIDAQYKEKLVSLIEEIKQKTPIEVVVVTVESFTPYDANEYSQILVDNWKIGKKNKNNNNNGVLILVSTKEKLWKINIGYGLAENLSDEFCGKVGKEYIMPYFKERQYGKGVYYAIAAIMREASLPTGVSIDTLKNIKLKGQPENIILAFCCFIFFIICNLLLPVFIGLPLTLLFVIIFYSGSPLTAILIIFAYVISMLLRFNSWLKLPPDKKPDLFHAMFYGLILRRKSPVLNPVVQEGII